MIYFLGDVHGNFDHILPAISEGSEDEQKTVIFLGDMEPQTPFEDCIRPLLDTGVAVWMIHGNHDTDSEENWRNLQDSQHRNLHGRVVEIEGLRVAGLGGIFRGDIWYPDHVPTFDGAKNHRNYAAYEKHVRQTCGLKNRLSKMDRIQMEAVPSPQWQGMLLGKSAQGKLLKHRSSIFPDVYDVLADQQADLLVTHEAPSCHRFGFATIDLLAQSMGVKTLFHGHHHISQDYAEWMERLGFMAYSVGFCGISNQHGKVVMPGDLDQHKREAEKQQVNS